MKALAKKTAAELYTGRDGMEYKIFYNATKQRYEVLTTSLTHATPAHLMRLWFTSKAQAKGAIDAQGVSPK